MNQVKRTAIFEILRSRNPHPATELIYRTPFELLVAVMLSAQATDVGVNKVTRRLFVVANTPQAVIDLGLARLKRIIKSIGLYNTKARNLMRTCRILIGDYDGHVPTDRPRLERLPGVGRKTANVILNAAFGLPTIAVDTHIFRVSNRTRLAPGKNVREVEDRLNRLVPEQFRKDAHHWLILHGRYLCTAREPKCGICPIFQLCEWSRKNACARAGTLRAV